MLIYKIKNDMKKMILIAILAIILTSCDSQKKVTLTNGLEYNSDGGNMAMRNIYLQHYIDGNMAGESFIDSLAIGTSSQKIKVPKNVEYIKVRCELVAQDTSRKSRFIAIFFAEKELEFGNHYYLDDNNTNITISGQTKYRSIKK